MTLPMHTVVFEAPNGYRETYDCYTWDEFYKACQAMERRGFVRVKWVQR